MLLTAATQALRNDLQKVAGLSHAVHVIRWVTGGLLLAAVPLLWLAGHGRCTLALHITLMAAIAAPPIGRQRDHLPWRNTVSLLLPLALVAVSLYLTTGDTQVGHSILTPMGLAFLICAGLAVRVLGEALSTLVNPNVSLSKTFDALCLTLTLLVGGRALVNLWQLGTIGKGTAAETGLAGAWLAWSAVWLSSREGRGLRAGLIAIAALSLILMSVRVN
jgi:hypothetical protein